MWTRSDPFVTHPEIARRGSRLGLVFPEGASEQQVGQQMSPYAAQLPGCLVDSNHSGSLIAAANYKGSTQPVYAPYAPSDTPFTDLCQLQMDNPGFRNGGHRAYQSQPHRGSLSSRHHHHHQQSHQQHEHFRPATPSPAFASPLRNEADSLSSKCYVNPLVAHARRQPLDSAPPSPSPPPPPPPPLLFGPPSSTSSALKYLVPAPVPSISASVAAAQQPSRYIHTAEGRKRDPRNHHPSSSSTYKKNYMAATPAKLTRTPLLRIWKLSFIKSDHSRRRLVLLYCILVFAVVLIVATGVLVIYLTVFGGLKGRQNAIEMDDMGEDVVMGRYRITNVDFYPTLYDTSSEDFRSLAKQVEAEMDRLFALSVIRSEYNGSRVSRLSRGSVLVECVVLLGVNGPTWQAAERVGVAFLRGLQPRHNRLWLGQFSVDVQSISFTETSPKPPLPPSTDRPLDTNLVAAWSPWSGWSPCKQPCRREYTQTRSRTCRLGEGQGRALSSIEPCLLQGGGDMEMRDCRCADSGDGSWGWTWTASTPAVDATTSVGATSPSATPVLSPSSSASFGASVPLLPGIGANQTYHPRACSECVSTEVCVALGGELSPTCRLPLDPRDPTGCGGLCLLSTQVCHRLDTDAYRCVNTSSCLGGEWQCGNRLCIPLAKRCDGHMNCYDRTDEDSCPCDLQYNFHCGHLTSCLPLEKKCDGRVDCWDGSDEYNCTEAVCPGAEEFTCNSGQCIPKQWFCDGYPDCRDQSDEPLGCKGDCKRYEWRCSNGRCILKEKRCNGVDDCGNRSDEMNCTNTN